MSTLNTWITGLTCACLVAIPSLGGDFDVDVTITEGHSGCGSAVEGFLQVTNMNEGVWIKVGWWGASPGGNLLFRNPPSHATLTGCNGSLACLNACPAPDPDDNCSTVDGGCDFIACCEECACEIPDATGIGLLEFGSSEEINGITYFHYFGRGCSLPRCAGHVTPPAEPTCDNPTSACNTGTPTPFCVTLQGKPESPQFELEQVSFDGTCFIDVGEPLTADVVSDCS